MTEEASSGSRINYSAHEKNLSSVFNRGFTSGYAQNSISDMFSANPSDASYREVSEVQSYSADQKYLKQHLPLLSILIKHPVPLNMMTDTVKLPEMKKAGKLFFLLLLCLREKTEKPVIFSLYAAERLDLKYLREGIVLKLRESLTAGLKRVMPFIQELPLC